MTNLLSLPRDRILAAMALPENRASLPALQEALQRASGLQGHRNTPDAADGVQRASNAARGAGKRRGIPTKLEAKFAKEILDPMVASGEIVGYECEGLTLRHAGTAVTPDYVGWEPSGRPALFEVKGTRLTEATVLRMKLHAAARPWLRWRIYSRRDGAWRVHYDSSLR